MVRAVTCSFIARQLQRMIADLKSSAPPALSYVSANHLKGWLSAVTGCQAVGCSLQYVAQLKVHVRHAGACLLAVCTLITQPAQLYIQRP